MGSPLFFLQVCLFLGDSLPLNYCEFETQIPYDISSSHHCLRYLNYVISVDSFGLVLSPSFFRYDSRNSFLEWSILLIDNSNRSGSLEFVVPPADTSVFFPISV
ncbi:hypothetical protein K1719_002803 [Acacia pycnantha]|nr:hypothetical protein K1719_002803 [Acacia pycnantha]